MTALLAQLLQAQQQGRLPAANGVSPDYIRKLLAANDQHTANTVAPPTDHPALPVQPLVEPLSARELEVLRLLAVGRSNPEIAQQFVVSINTVKTQLKSIYGKLNVHSRADAVAKARALRLVP